MSTTTELAQQLLAAADAAQSDAEQLLVDILKVPTVNSRATPEDIETCQKEVARCFDLLGKWAEKNGFTWRNYDNLVCVAELPATVTPAEGSASPEVIGVPLHIDVVPVNAADWAQPPFSGAIAPDADDHECIWGRGAQDDKGPTAAMLEAARLVKESGLPRTHTLKLVVGSTEETSVWECMKRFLEEEPAPDFSVVPDAEFPIINGEKGFITLYFNATWSQDDEPGDNSLDLLSLKSGRVENIVPDTAKATLFGVPTVEERINEIIEKLKIAQPAIDAKVEGESRDEWTKRYTLNVRGAAAHSSTPDRGTNAALAALEIVAESMFDSHPAALFAKFIAEIARETDASGLGMAKKHDFIGPTTSCLTILEIGDTSARAGINLRQTEGQTHEELFAAAQKLAAEKAPEVLNMTVEHNAVPRNPIYVDPAKFADKIDALKRSYTDVTEREASLLAIGGTTFAKAIPNAVCFGGIDEAAGEPSLIHQKDERVRRADYLRNLRIYTLALARLASGDNDLAGA